MSDDIIKRLRAAIAWLRAQQHIFDSHPKTATDKTPGGIADNIAALLDRLDKADEMRDVLLRNGFVECDISACNCGSWHHRYGLPEWMREIERVLADAGHERSNDNGHSILRALNALIDRLDKGLNALIARLDKAERENERLREDAERYRWLRGDACSGHSVRWTQWDVRCWVAPFWSDDLRREGLDRSIDAAMAAERGKE